jgi:hypothetical protein
LEPEERDELLEALLARLREEGVPAGAWLVDISKVRQALREADELLAELQRAIERGLRQGPT